MITYLS